VKGLVSLGKEDAPNDLELSLTAVSVPAGLVGAVTPDQSSGESTLARGATVQLAIGSAQADKLTWRSFQPEVAQVSAAGLATAKGPGVAVIAAVTGSGVVVGSTLIYVPDAKWAAPSPVETEACEGDDSDDD
jgi:hypothetical protein